MRTASSWERSMMKFARTALALYAMSASVAYAADAQSWQPDEATVREIESTLVLPSKDRWTPGPLAEYARYYTGSIKDGHRTIYGDFYRGRMASDRPGIYLHAPNGFSTGGGCDHIQLW